MNNQDWVDWVERENAAVTMTEEEAAQMNDLCDEIIRLQERVRIMEDKHDRPDKAFWGQLLFDVGIYALIIYMLLRG